MWLGLTVPQWWQSEKFTENKMPVPRASIVTKFVDIEKLGWTIYVERSAS